MIVCHCTQISDHDIRAAVDWMCALGPRDDHHARQDLSRAGQAGRLRRLHALFLDTMRQCDSLAVPPDP